MEEKLRKYNTTVHESVVMGGKKKGEAIDSDMKNKKKRELLITLIRE